MRQLWILVVMQTICLFALGLMLWDVDRETIKAQQDIAHLTAENAALKMRVYRLERQVVVIDPYPCEFRWGDVFLTLEPDGRTVLGVELQW
jgi:hypothetical protein